MSAGTPPALADVDEPAVRWISLAYEQSRTLEERIGYLRGLEACKREMGDHSIARAIRVFVDHLEQRAPALRGLPAGAAEPDSTPIHEILVESELRVLELAVAKDHEFVSATHGVDALAIRSLIDLGFLVRLYPGDGCLDPTTWIGGRATDAGRDLMARHKARRDGVPFASPFVEKS